MKRLFPFAIIGLILVSSCTTKKPALLNPKNLQSSFIKIYNDSTYHLKTAKGAIVNIPANCFDVPAGSSVDIEIKEAYSMQDILKAGLTTMSNGKLLQSGGMIFFNATADNKPVKFLKEVGLTIPSKVYNNSMKVFKGELTEDSTINWVEPKPVDSSDAMKSLPEGEALFKANCANCHKPLEDFTGPLLAGARRRAPSPDWPYKFVNQTNKMIEEDPYARWLLRKYGSKMTQFNGIKTEETRAILDYCDNEALLYNPAVLLVKPQAYLQDSAYIADSVTYNCYDTILVTKDTGFTNITSKDLPEDNFKADDYIPNTATPMYSFNINQSGWYNIDCFVQENEKAVTNVRLTAALSENGFENDIQLYLCLPNKKLLTEGSIDEKIYTFSSGDSIPLILNEQAYVFAVGKKSNQFYYGITGFKVKSDQHIVIKLLPVTEQQVEDDLKKNKIQDVKLDPEQPVIQTFLPADSSNQQIEKQVIERQCDPTFPSAIVAFQK